MFCLLFIIGECIAVDPIKNAIKHLEQEKILDHHFNSDASKMLSLNCNYASSTEIDVVINEINSYRISHK